MNGLVVQFLFLLIIILSTFCMFPSLYIGTFPVISNLLSLRIVDGFTNKFTGMLFHVKHLFFIQFYIHGRIVLSIYSGPYPVVSTLTKLTYLNLGGNSFAAGPIPVVSTLRSITLLLLASLHRSGTIMRCISKKLF